MARFVVQTGTPATVDQLESLLVDGLGPPVVVERLFPTSNPGETPDEMRRMFVVLVREDSLPHDNAWDNAYWLEDEFEFAESEPDSQTTLQEPLEVSGTCRVDNPPPVDKQWSLREIRAPRAWELEPPEGGRKMGEGVRICHPDTGWAAHVDLDARGLDLDHALNLLRTGPSDARDPLDYSGPLLHPGHGTGTGSVIMSGHETGGIMGVAPAASLVPIRTAKSVIQVFDSDLARAIDHAVAVQCDVVSMSLGGRAFFGLEAAIRRAVERNVIVVAAAGNCVRFVVAPAAYDDAIAIAATNFEGEPWRGSSRGGSVDISAPGEHVWRAAAPASTSLGEEVEAGQGTSFAVANVAGAAGLWLAFHGRECLGDRYDGQQPLQEVFRTLLKQTARSPAGWEPDRFGAGILDVLTLLQAPLPEPAAVVLESTGADPDDLRMLARVTDRTTAELRPLLAATFSVPPGDVDETIARFGAELVQLALGDPNGFDRMLSSLEETESRGEAEHAATQAVLAEASSALRAAAGEEL